MNVQFYFPRTLLGCAFNLEMVAFITCWITDPLAGSCGPGHMGPLGPGVPPDGKEAGALPASLDLTCCCTDWVIYSAFDFDILTTVFRKKKISLSAAS